MSNGNPKADEIMSTNAISPSSQNNFAAIVGTPVRPHRHGGDGGDRNSSGDGNDQGINLLASLLQALTQAVSGAPATTTGTTATDGTAAAGTATATATGSTASGTSIA